MFIHRRASLVKRISFGARRVYKRYSKKSLVSAAYDWHGPIYTVTFDGCKRTAIANCTRNYKQ